MDSEKKSIRFEYVKSTFEYLTIEKIPYWVFWPIIGLIFYIVSELLIFYFNEERFFICQLFLIFGIYSYPVAFIYFSRKFSSVIGNLYKIFWQNEESAIAWYDYHAKRTFTLDTIYSKIIFLIVFVLVNLTPLYLGIPFYNNKLKIISLFGFSLIAFIGANAVAMLINIFITLQDLVKLVPKTPFFMFPHRSLVKLQNYYFLISSIVTIAYFCLIITFKNSPYGLNFLVMLWLTFLAMFPFGLFFWSLFKIHELITIAKYNQIKLINDRIQIQLKGLLNDDEKSINNLKKCMDIQQKIASISEWPINLKSIIALIIALLPLLFQIFTQIQKYYFL